MDVVFFLIIKLGRYDQLIGLVSGTMIQILLRTNYLADVMEWKVDMYLQMKADTRRRDIHPSSKWRAG